MKTIATVIAVMVALLSFNASADVLKYRFTGQVTDMAEYNNGTGTSTELRSSDLAGKPVTVEELVIGYFSYDTAVALLPKQYDPGAFGSYLRYGGGVHASLAFTGGGLEYRSNAAPTYSSVTVANGPELFDGRDQISFRTIAGSIPLYETLSITFWDQTGTALSNPNIPAHLSLGDFSYGSFSYSWRDDDGIDLLVLGLLTSLTAVDDVQPVPEPASWLLILIGITAIGTVARRRKVH